MRDCVIGASSEKGDYGWVFDNREDSVAPLLETSALMGFDVTDFLDNPVTGGPVTMYLFQIVEAPARWPTPGRVDGRILEAALRPVF